MFAEVEICGCGHALSDHRGKPCMHEAPDGSGLQKCPCPQGMRTDIVMIRQQSQILQLLANLNQTIFKQLLLAQALSGYEVDIQQQPNGDTQVVVKPINKQGGIITPGTPGPPHNSQH